MNIFLLYIFLFLCQRVNVLDFNRTEVLRELWISPHFKEDSFGHEVFLSSQA